jgi:hypothetical protein
LIAKPAKNRAEILFTFFRLTKLARGGELRAPPVWRRLFTWRLAMGIG